MTRLLLLAAALGVAGCSLTGDCSFDKTEERRFGNTLQADAPALGDTLTLVIVNSGYPQLRAFVPAGLRLAEPSTNETVRVGYAAEGRVFSESQTPQLAAVARGDSVYIYIEGSLNPSLVTQVCSPPEVDIRVDLSSVSAPPRVRALRVSHIDADTLPQPTAQALRQRDASRPARPLTV